KLRSRARGPARTRRTDRTTGPTHTGSAAGRNMDGTRSLRRLLVFRSEPPRSATADPHRPQSILFTNRSNQMMSAFELFLFQYYPYVCLSVFLVGSLIRFDRDQYTWKSDSSQLLRARQLRWGSNLFHIGILLLLFGHLFGMLTPHW